MDLHGPPESGGPRVRPCPTEVVGFWDHPHVTLGNHLSSSFIFHLYFEPHLVICKAHSRLSFKSCTTVHPLTWVVVPFYG